MLPKVRRTARRRLVAALAGALALPLRLVAQPVHPHISAIDPTVRWFTSGAEVRPGRVKLRLPAHAENGHSVEMTVEVASPMTETDYVKAIHLIADRNPVRDMASFYLGPRAGRAEVSSRVRLAGTQRVIALAELSDGTFWSDAAEVAVTVPACVEGT